MTVVLAARNLFRNTRRTVITLLAIAFGLTMVHLTITLQTGTYADMIEAGVDTMAGHVVVEPAGARDSRDADLVLARASEVATALATEFPDARIATRLSLGGLLTSPRSSVGAALNGLEAGVEAELRDIDEQVVTGTWLDGDGRGLVIGEKLAESLQVGLGDKVVYLGQHGGADEVSSRLFRIKGIFHTGAPELDGFVAFADLSAVQAVFGEADVAQQVTVHFDDPNRSFPAAARSRVLLADRPDVAVLDWRQALPEICAVIEVDKQSGNLIMAIIGAIVAMGALNTVLMSALERTREFGVMLSLGLRPGQLSRLILAEGLLLGALGALLGLGLGALVSWPLVTYGLDYRDYVGENFESSGVVISGLMKGRYDVARMLTYSVVAVFFTAAAALYPAWYVSRLQPVEAMRHT